MKKLTPLEQPAQNLRETSNCLNAIELLIKTKEHRELGSELLGKINSQLLSPKHLAHYHYLNARYFVYKFRQENDIENLEYANDFLDQMMSSAYENNYTVEDAKFLFTRAHTKMQLAELVWEEERKPWLLKKANHIVEVSLRHHPENSSFQWLQERLSA